MMSTESLPAPVERLRWDRRRHPPSGRRAYSQAARQVAPQAERILTVGGREDRRTLVPPLRTAVNRVTAALQYLDDSSGSIGGDLRALMQLYARACCAVPPSSPASLAKWRSSWCGRSGGPLATWVDPCRVPCSDVGGP